MVLAIDTSTEACAIAIGSGDDWREDVEHAGQRHSELLIPMISRSLVAAAVNLAELEGVALGVGPGSFTGLRIGCGVAQGLALGAGLPVARVSSLLAIAEGARQRCGARRVIAAVDARMREVYLGAYAFEAGSWRVECEPIVVKPDAVPRFEGEWFAAGNGFAAYPMLAERLGLCAGQSDAAAIPSPRAIGRLGELLLRRNLGVAAGEARPLYVRHRIALTSAERASGLSL